MSIADKLTYLQTTKQLLKTEINKINNVLTDESTFRSYPQELFNGYLDVLNNGTDTLWSNLEKVSQTGTEPILEGVETAPMKMVLNGNTSQETTSGKNVFNYTRTTKTITTNGVTSTINDDGSITLDGTATSLVWFVLNSAFNWERGDYTMYLNDNEIVGLLLYSDVGVTGAIKQINIPTAITKNIALRIASGTSFNNLTIFPMILKGKYTLENIGDYEPYTGGLPSPNPDYPQKVKIVTGENVVSVSGKNLFDKDITLHSGWYNDNGVFNSSTATGHTEEKYDVSPNQTYTLTGNAISYDTTYVISRVYFYDKENNWISRTLINQATFSFTTPSNCYHIDFQIAIVTKTDGEYDHYYDDIKDNIQLELGSATPYVPYSKTDYPINLGDIELCKINTYKDYFHKDSGKWYVHKEIGKVILSSNAYVSDLAFGTNSYSLSLPYSHFMAVDNAKIMVLSNKYKGISYNDRTQEISNSIYQPNYNNRIDFRNTNFTSVEDFKTNNIGTIVYLVLATPTETEITNSTLIEQLEAISKAKSVKDKTFITQTNDELPFILDVEAIKEYEVI